MHGHDGETKMVVARFLTALLGRQPLILHEQPDRGRTIIEKFQDHAAQAACAIVLLTGDDEGGPAGGTGQPRARQNVELRRKTRQLEVENEILKRAAAYDLPDLSYLYLLRLVAKRPRK